ncbi:MAG: sugar kinase [Caulobacter sp.]|nr:sugar kinase [Caulobacter sp.]
MVDLSGEMGGLWASLGAPAPGRSRVVQFVAAHRGEGTSTVAREFARFAARRAGKTVWLVDLDLHASPQHAAIAADPQLYGPLGPAVSASPDGSTFVTVQPPSRNAEGVAVPDARYVAAHAVGEGRWWVTRFRKEGLKGRQTVHILPGADYWNALRKHADLVVIDSPAADRSQAALTVAPFIDQTVLVVAADQPDVRSPAQLRDAIVTAGGRCAGVFFNRARVEPPGFLRRILG